MKKKCDDKSPPQRIYLDNEIPVKRVVDFDYSDGCGILISIVFLIQLIKHRIKHLRLFQKWKGGTLFFKEQSRWTRVR